MAKSANYNFQHQNKELIYWENRAPNFNVTFKMNTFKIGGKSIINSDKQGWLDVFLTDEMENSKNTRLTKFRLHFNCALICWTKSKAKELTLSV